MSDETPVNVRLKQDQVEELEAIMRWHGLENRTDTIRYLIRHEARRIEQRRTPMTVPTDEPAH